MPSFADAPQSRTEIGDLGGVRLTDEQRARRYQFVPLWAGVRGALAARGWTASHPGSIVELYVTRETPQALVRLWLSPTGGQLRVRLDFATPPARAAARRALDAADWSSYGRVGTGEPKLRRQALAGLPLDVAVQLGELLAGCDGATQMSQQFARFVGHVVDVATAPLALSTPSRVAGGASPGNWAGTTAKTAGPPGDDASAGDTDADDAESDVAELRARLAGSPTMRDALTQARVGQGQFRRDLLRYWGVCAVTGVGVPAALRASHIQPWRASTDTERLDPFNGLLLTATLDALFDRGLITFTDGGELVPSDQLDRVERDRLGLTSGMRIRRPLERAHLQYLARHRERWSR